MSTSSFLYGMIIATMIFSPSVAIILSIILCLYLLVKSLYKYFVNDVKSSVRSEIRSTIRREIKKDEKQPSAQDEINKYIEAVLTQKTEELLVSEVEPVPETLISGDSQETIIPEENILVNPKSESSDSEMISTFEDIGEVVQE